MTDERDWEDRQDELREEAWQKDLQARLHGAWIRTANKPRRPEHRVEILMKELRRVLAKGPTSREHELNLQLVYDQWGLGHMLKVIAGFVEEEG